MRSQDGYGEIATARHNLPADIASFIGREKELAEIARLLTTTRLLTLTGAGGSGKTRLAQRAAVDAVRTFSDGVWLVQFAPVTDGASLPRRIMTVLGIRGLPGQPLLGTLAASLASRHLLLLLDNCEHLIGACARLVETLLQACPHLHLLATSREPLRVPGETTWRVPPLTLPDKADVSTASLAQVEAVALFVDRARARRPDFALTDANAPTIATICSKVEGLPLGIELAAARIVALTPEQIVERLGDSLNVLSGGSRVASRHETLRGTLAWSDALLSEPERTLFRRLAVFAESFDLLAAEAVCSGGEIERAAVLDLLSSLVEKSLVEPSFRGVEARYRLLEPVRQYALASLTERGEIEAVRRRHALHYVSLAEEAEPALMSGARGPWLARLATEQDNLRAALVWSRGASPHDATLGLRLVGALFWFWVFRGEISEGRDATEAALARAHDAEPAVMAKALHAAGEFAWLLGQMQTARERLERSASLYRALGDRRGLGYALQILPMVIRPFDRSPAVESLALFEAVGDEWGAAHAAMTLGMIDFEEGHLTEARATLEAALARWTRVGDGWGIAQAQNFLGDLMRRHDKVAEATSYYLASLTQLRALGIEGTVPSLLHNLGYLALRSGDTRKATQRFRTSLILFREQGDMRGVAECLAGLAGVFGIRRQADRATVLLGAAEKLLETLGAAIATANTADYHQTLNVLRAQQSEAAFARTWAVGRGMPLERAIAEAMAPDETEATRDTAHALAALGITERERQVAVLVANGKTNRQIGVDLVITEGTARLHVKHILRKLGLASRTQLARWAIEHQLVDGLGTNEVRG